MLKTKNSGVPGVGGLCFPQELMKEIEPPDSHHLSAAIGWLGLGNWQEANEELDKIAPALRAHPSFRMVKYEVLAKAGKWDDAAEIARGLIQLDPKDPQYWIWHAYATRRMTSGGIPQAREILSKAQKLIPKEPLTSYNLGCYECQLGNLQTARQWLEKTFAVGDPKTFKSLALEDRDLEPLWPEIRQI
jgi:Flp pilus assembly protein TadD